MNAKVHLNISGVVLLFVFSVAAGSVVFGETITPSPYWKNEISFPEELVFLSVPYSGLLLW